MGCRHSLIVLAVVVVTACSSGGSGSAAHPSPRSSPLPAQSPSLSGDANAQPTRNIYVISPLVVRGLATFASFLDAYNAGRARDAVALAADDIAGNDCDYRTTAVIDFTGKAAMAKWLDSRIADHDRFVVSDVYNLSGDTNVIGVVWAHRTSDYLAAHGFANGITPNVRAKIVFDSTNEHIRGFANAPPVGPTPECAPTA